MTDYNIEYTNTKPGETISKTQYTILQNSIFIDYNGDVATSYAITSPIASVTITIAGGDAVSSSSVSPIIPLSQTIGWSQSLVLALVLDQVKALGTPGITVNSSNDALKEVVEGMLRNSDG
jgi:hypothetical protein